MVLAGTSCEPYGTGGLPRPSAQKAPLPGKSTPRVVRKEQTDTPAHTRRRVGQSNTHGAVGPRVIWSKRAGREGGTPPTSTRTNVPSCHLASSLARARQPQPGDGGPGTPTNNWRNTPDHRPDALHGQSRQTQGAAWRQITGPPGTSPSTERLSSADTVAFPTSGTGTPARRTGPRSRTESWCIRFSHAAM